MPASDHLKAKMVAKFGDRPFIGPIQYLQKAGYKLSKDWRWAPKPGVKTLRHMETLEWECLLYLCQEHGFGGLTSYMHEAGMPIYNYDFSSQKVRPMTTDNNEPKLTLDEAKEVLKSAPAPRVTEESIKAKIAKVDYLIHDQMTICFITMQNGWMSVGHSKPASAANYDEGVGYRYAYDNAFKPLWQLEGYLLVDMLYRASIGG